MVAQAEIGRLRSHAERTVGHIESQMVEENLGSDLSQILTAIWLRSYWHRTIPTRTEHLYAAIVSAPGTVIAHSGPVNEGQELQRDWALRPFLLAGGGVVESVDPALTSGSRAYDISLPIMVQGQHVATYHAGMNADWLDSQLVTARWRVLRGWMVVIAGILAVVLGSGVAVHTINRRAAVLRLRLAQAEFRRVAERSHLLIGVVHEIRNPLNTLRLNFHALEQIHHNRADLSPAEVCEVLEDSTREIERVDELMRGMLELAFEDQADDEVVNFVEELGAVVDFLQSSIERERVTIERRIPLGRLNVRISRARARQILLNVLHNACESMPEGGKITATVVQGNDSLEIRIADQGRGVATENLDRIFDPFFTTKDNGTGLGLALVRKFVEEANGTVACEHNQGGGAVMRVRLPLVSYSEGGAAT